MSTPLDLEAPGTGGTLPDERPEREERPEHDAGRPRWQAPAIVGAAAAAGTAAIVAVNPTDTGVPICWSQSMLGIDCPLCGGLRCVNALARGDLVAAVDHNVLAAVALPVAALVWAWWMVRSLQDRPFRLPNVPVWALTLLAVLVAAFTIARNLDAGPAVEWLASTRTGS